MPRRVGAPGQAAGGGEAVGPGAQGIRPGPADGHAPGGPRRAARRAITGASFWLAILLPLAYLPLLLAPGTVPAGTLPAFILLHGLAILAGHGYGRESPPGGTGG